MKMRRIVMSLLLGIIFYPGLISAKTSSISGAFGANIHLRQRIASVDWNSTLDQANEIGVQWGREEFHWDVIEPTDDNFQWDTYDTIVDDYQAHDIKVLGLLTYSSEWASVNSGSSQAQFYPPDETAWEDYVSTVATHYAGQVDAWEIWNEPNADGFWKGSRAEYISTFTIAAQAIRSADPDAKIVLGGTAGTDTEFIADVLEGITDRSLIDVVAVHPYRVLDDNFNYAPEDTVSGLNSLIVDLYNTRATLNLYGLTTTPIWLTEVGWTTYASGVSQDQQAQLLSRLYPLALSVSGVKKVFWYSFNDTGSDTSYLESHFGLVDSTGALKPAAQAYQFVAKQFTNSVIKRIDFARSTLLSDFTNPADWKFVDVVCTDGSLRSSDERDRLQVTYTFTATSNCYAPIVLNQRLPKKTKAISVRVKGSDDDTLLRIRVIDATGEVLQYNAGLMPAIWQPVFVDLTQPSAHWNGDNDGVLDRPAVFNSFVLDNTDGSLASGTVWFDDLLSAKQPHVYNLSFHKGKYDRQAIWQSSDAQTSVTLSNDAITHWKVRLVNFPSRVVTGRSQITVAARRLLKIVVLEK